MVTSQNQSICNLGAARKSVRQPCTGNTDASVICQSIANLSSSKLLQTDCYFVHRKLVSERSAICITRDATNNLQDRIKAFGKCS